VNKRRVRTAAGGSYFDIACGSSRRRRRANGSQDKFTPPRASRTFINTPHWSEDVCVIFGVGYVAVDVVAAEQVRVQGNGEPRRHRGHVCRAGRRWFWYQL